MQPPPPLRLLKQGWKAWMLVIPLFGSGELTDSQAGVPEDEGTSPFQPPLDIVSTNNRANKEPLLLT